MTAVARAAAAPPEAALGPAAGAGAGVGAGVNAAFVAPDDARWPALLARVRHDVYHLPGYSVAAASHEGGEPWAFHATLGEDAFLLPLLLRPLPTTLGREPGGQDATSPYGYPGPVCTSPEDAVLVARFLDAFREAGRAHGLVSAFIRLHPLRPVAEAALAAAGTLVRHGPVAYSSLAVTAESLWSQTRPNHRVGIHKLQRAGFVVRRDHWDRIGAFRDAYAATMRRVAAADFYYFGDAYFDALRNQLGDALHLFTVESPDGTVAAAGLFTAVDGIVEYHLGGTSDEHVALAPSKLMFHAVREWARASGHAVVNLGGGLGGLPGPLLNFKAGFARSSADFCTLRVVLDPGRYEALCAAAGADGADESDFFPRYRRTRSA